MSTEEEKEPDILITVTAASKMMFGGDGVLNRALISCPDFFPFKIIKKNYNYIDEVKFKEFFDQYGGERMISAAQLKLRLDVTFFQFKRIMEMTDFYKEVKTLSIPFKNHRKDFYCKADLNKWLCKQHIRPFK